MSVFGSDGRCLMRTLQQELDDGEAEDCGRCSVCTGPRYGHPLDPRLVQLAERHLRSRGIELEIKKMAPDATGAMRKIPQDVRIEPGWSLARVGDGGWWPAVEQGLLDGCEFGDQVVGGLADLLRRAGVQVDWITAVPSVRLGEKLADLGRRLGEEVSAPFVELIARRESRPPQREMSNAAAQTANVRGAFRVVSGPPRGTGVLLDDTRGSGWTLAMNQISW
jgi:ATP-dependent DNA helicase RecQ